MLYLCPVIAFVTLFAFPNEAFRGGFLGRLVGRVAHAGAAGAPGSLLLWANPSMDNAVMAAFGMTGLGVVCSAAILLPSLRTVSTPAPKAAPAAQAVQPAAESFNDALWQKALTPATK